MMVTSASAPILRLLQSFWAVEDVITRSRTASGHGMGPVSPLAIKLVAFGKLALIQA